MFSPAARHSDERCIKLGCRFYISMFPGVVIATTVNNMAHEDNHRIQRSKRVFINNVDIYASNYIGKFLSASYIGSTLEEATDDFEEEDLSPRNPGQQKVKPGGYKIVGTIRDQSDSKKCIYTSEEYHQLDRNKLLKQMLECDVIIYNITEYADQIEEASWAVKALHEKMDTFFSPKTFILVSTVMTWALSKPVDALDLAIPFTDEDYRRRRPHPSFKQHINAEKLVVKLGKTKSSQFSTYVVASGLQYGMGEQVFHFFFKASWLGEIPKVPIFGEASALPTIHINDLARFACFFFIGFFCLFYCSLSVLCLIFCVIPVSSVILNLIDHKPMQQYIVAVDDSYNTNEDIVKTISSTLGPGRTAVVPAEEAFLVRELTQTYIDLLSVNLRFEAVFIKERLNIRWVSEAGLIENIEHVVEEYKQTRGLLPIRICVLGPPAVGKSTIAQKICRHYKLHHVRLRDTISETIAHLESLIHVDNPDEESADMASGAQEQLDTLKDNMEQNGGRLDDQYVIKIIRDKLKSKPCQNQGFVLDGFPKTYDQAKELFNADDEEGVDMKNLKICPEFIFPLDATDAFLKDRVLHLPEKEVEGSSYTRERFPHRLSNYRDNNTEDETVLNYFDELNIQAESFEITSVDDMDYLVVTERIVKRVGPSQNYGPTTKELQEAERTRTEARLKKEAEQKAEMERLEAEEAAQREARWEEWVSRVEVESNVGAK
ncbi:adenylate kinase 7 isoform X1 [Clupea harengus]|uniref:Adenylate kinase 7 isoform X1 n=1 Tax=Clupea harengus TaxID=7950 RepID=A0A8M1KNQ6_CLUHA|nr:adenylate kinase 7 isoform X1 [Clupea harengus]